jgi:hypothetical protein
MGEAADAPVAVWVDYRAPEDCPDRALLMSRIAERNARLDESSEAPPAQRYRVVIAPATSGYTGRLEQPETGAVREVSGVDCVRVVDALALVVALSATGDLDLEEATVELEETAEPATVPLAPAAGERIDSSPSGTPAAIGFSRRGHAPWLVAAGATVLTGLGQNPFAGPVVGFDWAHDDGWLSLRGSGRWAFEFSGAEGASTWQLVPELCFWVPAGPLELSGCGGSAFGRRIAGEAGSSSPWVAPLVSAGFRLPLGGSSYGELRAEVDFPLDQVTERDYATPPVTFGASLVVGFGGQARGGMKTATAGHGGR